jgi:fumarate reductase flavoprotein subunit
MSDEMREFVEAELPPVLPEDIKETYEADVVVAGAGASGKAAALSAAEAGVRVIQIDKHVTYRWGGGLIAAIDSRLQRQLDVKVDKDKVILELMKWGGNKPDQRLYRLWADNSGLVLDWLTDMTDKEGIQLLPYQWPRPVNYEPEKEYYPDFPVGHRHSDGKIMALNHKLALDIAQEHALKKGVDIRYRTAAVQLVRQQNGRVSGLVARDPAGNYVQFKACKAVIICTGDYGNNPRMMEKYCPIAAEVAREHNIYMTRNDDLLNAPEPINVGDGHLMAMGVGAVMEPPPHAPMSHATVGPSGQNAFLRVNIDGERYENEDVPGQSTANSLVRQPGKRVWQVFDSKWETEISRMGVGLGTFYEVNDMLRTQVEETTLKAETIEKLARKMEVPVGNFKATIDRYNQLVRLGRDLDFGKRSDRLTTVDKPPFYAGIIEQHLLVVLGGLNTNMKLQPLDGKGKVIPGLYLAGNTVGRRFAVDYPTMCAGLSHGFAWTTGRLAGLNAAAEDV